MRYQYQKKAKVESVEIDPDHKIQFDRNNFDNSYIVEAKTAPAQQDRALLGIHQPVRGPIRDLVAGLGEMFHE